MGKDRDYSKEYNARKDKFVKEFGIQAWRAKGREKAHKYEKTKKGFVMRMYRNMKSRVTGVQKAKFHLYEGLELMPKQEFYDLVLNDAGFNQLFTEWENSGYDRKLTPSPDRMDSSRGYTPDNIDFVTHSVNSRNGSYSKHGLI